MKLLTSTIYIDIYTFPNLKYLKRVAICPKNSNKAVADIRRGIKKCIQKYRDSVKSSLNL